MSARVWCFGRASCGLLAVMWCRCCVGVVVWLEFAGILARVNLSGELGFVGVCCWRGLVLVEIYRVSGSSEVRCRSCTLVFEAGASDSGSGLLGFVGVCTCSCICVRVKLLLKKTTAYLWRRRLQGGQILLISFYYFSRITISFFFNYFSRFFSF